MGRLGVDPGTGLKGSLRRLRGKPIIMDRLCSDGNCVVVRCTGLVVLPKYEA